MTRLADIPQITVKDLIDNYMDERDRWEWENYREPIGCLSRAQGRFLYQYRSDDFPIDAKPGYYWFDASGNLWALHPDGSRWIDLHQALEGRHVYRGWDRETGKLLEGEQA